LQERNLLISVIHEGAQVGYTVAKKAQIFYSDMRAVVNTTQIAAAQFDFIRKKKQEYFVMLTLDGARRLIKKHTIFIGTLNASLVHPREVFVLAIKDRAASIIIAHNHPSGSPDVSVQDREVTKRIKEAGELMGIKLDDHIIIAGDGFVSAL
jgi:DNA repair protein RadC